MHFTPFANMQAPTPIPAGTVVALVSTLAWTPPASNEIKDGWALANGLPYPTGSHPSFSGNRPDISSSRFIMGGITPGGTGGNNSVSLVEGNIPTLSDTFTSDSAGSHSHVATPTLSSTGLHSHTFVTGNIDTNHIHNVYGDSSIINDFSHAHSMALAVLNFGAGGNYGAGTNNFENAFYQYQYTLGQNQDHTHLIATAFGSGGGIPHKHVLGLTNYISAVHDHPVALTVDPFQSPAYHFHGVGVSLGSASPTAVENRPTYFSTIFLIAVGNVDYPLGAILPMATDTAWTLPAGTEVIGGWALCNGGFFPSGSHPSFSGQLRPNLTDNRFLLGSSSVGSISGDLSVIPINSANIPQLYDIVTSVTGSPDHSHVWTATNSNPLAADHKHGFDTSDTTWAHTHYDSNLTSYTTSVNHNHLFFLNKDLAAYPGTNNAVRVDNDPGAIIGTYHSIVSDHSHPNIGSYTVSSDATHGHTSANTDPDPVHSHVWPAFSSDPNTVTHTHTWTADPIKLGTVSPIAINNTPNYYKVQFLIRAS